MNHSSPVLKGSLLVYENSDVDIDHLIRLYVVKDREGNDFKLYTYDEGIGLYSFPRSAIRYIDDFVDLRTIGRSIGAQDKSGFIARDYQEGIASKICDYLSNYLGGVYVAGCGTGKTILASEVIIRMDRPACVLVHKDFLAEQWVNAFKMILPSYRVGFLKQDREDNGNDFDVVIASTQSVTSPTRKYSDDFYNSFGFLVADECHRYGAEVWVKAISKFPATYRLGLTATPNRADGLWRVLDDHIGKIGVELKTDPIPNKVYLVPMVTPIDTSQLQKKWLTDIQKRAKLISLLANHEGRNEVIARNILKAYKASRHILVISERRVQLDILSKLLIRNGIPKDHIGFYVGGMKRDMRNEAAEKPLILTTYQMTKEGLDIERLDTLFLATPQGNVIQTVGRILRSLEGKALPMTVDFVDTNIDMAKGLAYSRLKNYRKLNCDIKGTLQKA